MSFLLNRHRVKRNEKEVQMKNVIAVCISKCRLKLLILFGQKLNLPLRSSIYLPPSLDVLRDLNASVFNNIQQWVLECFNTTRLVGEPSIAEATRSFPVLNNTTPGKLYTALVITPRYPEIEL
ncbi:origin recognition complex subunit 3-like [Trifolium medium]|uniref:Origin recognition complex subunit 3-like n=1 Tax=Trifolium medium TaxID=97028 RepID=A0A392PP02_9FABA|nr:origin recognition complex subunit 3-like [Trifolium medium]